jgi:hypothetical protein
MFCLKAFSYYVKEYKYSDGVKFVRYIYHLYPVTVAGRSKPCTVFACSEAGTLGSNPTQGVDVLSVFILCLCCPVFR